MEILREPGTWPALKNCENSWFLICLRPAFLNYFHQVHYPVSFEVKSERFYSVFGYIFITSAEEQNHKSDKKSASYLYQNEGSCHIFANCEAIVYQNPLKMTHYNLTILSHMMVKYQTPSLYNFQANRI